MDINRQYSRPSTCPGGTLVPFSSYAGERVRVLSGRVWLTEEGNPRDDITGQRRGDSAGQGTGWR